MLVNDEEKGGERMNIMNVQASHMPIQQTSSKSVGESSGKFGSMLSNNVSNLSTTSVGGETTEIGDNGIEEELASLLEILLIGDFRDVEQGEQLVEEMLYTTASFEEHPLLKELIGMGESQSIEEMLASLLAGGSERETIEVGNMLQQLQQFIATLNEGETLPFVRDQTSAVETILKFSKMYTLMKNHLDLSHEQVENMDQLEKALEKLTSKLEEIVQSVSKDKGNAVTLLLGRQPFANVVQSSQSQTSTTGIQSESVGIHNPFMNMSKVEQYVLNTQSTKTSSDSDALLKSFENILSKAKFTNQNGIQKLLIKLNPENLGTLRIELMQREGIMMARIIASSNGAKELLDGQLHGLKQAFSNQNIPVEKIELSQQFSNLSQERNLQREQFQQQGGNERPEQSFDREEELEEDFQQTFEEAILQVKV